MYYEARRTSRQEALASQPLSSTEFAEFINCLHPTIKFELAFSEHEHVLDWTLHLINGFIKTDIYSKQTDSHLYLPPSIARPKHVFNAFPYGVATRLQRNYSEQVFLAKRKTEYKGYPVNQGYPSK